MHTSKEYKKRIIDDVLEFRLATFGAVLVVGPKWCGKTTTCEQKAKSVLRLQDPDAIIKYKAASDIKPSLLLDGENPRLIDEWQIIPSIWDSVRTQVDIKKEKGLFILTGSNSVKEKDNMHSGIGRISRLKMYPMSLYESDESNGKISLKDLFNDANLKIDFIESNMQIEDYIFASCRGGLPEAVLAKDDKSKLFIVKDYINSIISVDMKTVDDVKRNENLTRLILKTYARNISTLAKKSSMLADISEEYETISSPTFDSYLAALKSLYVIEEVEAWNLNIRSKTSVRANNKREFVDPSFAVAALGITPYDLLDDLNTFGFIFENLCIRDLRIYSEYMGAKISYYRDRSGLEADAILTLDNGKYALIECKLGSSEIDKGATNLLHIKDLIEKKGMRTPDLLIVITGGKIAYEREDGVKVIPLGCMKM